MTLVFLGYRPEKEISAIVETALEALTGAHPPRLAARGVAGVPPRRPRLFAIDLHDEDGRAASVQSAAALGLADRGFYRPERRPFWPHITLARVKRDRRAPPLEAPPPPSAAFEATEVVLYRSVLRPEGARYEALERLTLPGK